MNGLDEQKRILGQKISRLRTMGSMYDHGDTVVVYFDLDGKVVEGRIKTHTLVQMVNDFTFEVVKKKTYYHLENPVPIIFD